jgi:hypothetical protein
MNFLSVRPLQESDIQYIVDYWFKSTDEFLLQMGADKSKLISENDFSNSLQLICNTPLSERKFHYMIWLIDNEPVGYNALKDISTNNIAHMHLHMWNVDYRGKGFGAKLFCIAALEFYKIFNLKMILCEPRASNPIPNRMLTKIGFPKWKTYLSTSSELALTCELNSYIIDPEIAAHFLNQ